MTRNRVMWARMMVMQLFSLFTPLCHGARCSLKCIGLWFESIILEYCICVVNYCRCSQAPGGEGITRPRYCSSW